MLDDLAWRKLPRNIIRDEELDYISSLMPPELAAAPLLFYIVAYCKADDDGSFDVQDGVIFSRMMKTCAPEQVLQLANIMVQRNILSAVYNSPTKNVYLFNDWDVPQRVGGSKARTMDQRRAVVKEKIDEAERQRAALAQPVQINFTAQRQAAPSFFCAHDDKIEKNVDRTEREREERENRQTDSGDLRLETKEIDRKETHTESCGNFFPELPTQQKQIQSGAQTTEAEQETKVLAALAQQESNINVSEIGNNQEKEALRESTPCDTKNAYVVFKSFFAKNCLGFTEQVSHNTLLELSKAVTMLQNEINSPDVIATQFCNQFKKLVESPGYYHNYPLTPEELLKPGVYKTVLSLVSRILCHKAETNAAWKAQEEAAEKAMANHGAIYDELANEFVKLGIDPESPTALSEYMLRAPKKGIP